MGSRTKINIDFFEFEDYLNELRSLGGNVKETMEEALIKSHEYVTPLIEDKLQKSNLPAKGKYSTPNRENSLKQVIRKPNLVWNGTRCSIDVGFSLEESKIPLLLMTGTPKMQPVSGLKTIIEGKTTHKKIAQIQQNVIVESMVKHGR